MHPHPLFTPLPERLSTDAAALQPAAFGISCALLPFQSVK